MRTLLALLLLGCSSSSSTPQNPADAGRGAPDANQGPDASAPEGAGTVMDASMSPPRDAAFQDAEADAAECATGEWRCASQSEIQLCLAGVWVHSQNCIGTPVPHCVCSGNVACSCQ